MTQGALIAKIRRRTARVAVVGLGYVGLPTAIRIAEQRYHVTGVDLRREVVETMAAGRSPLPDAVPHGAVAKAARQGRLAASADTTKATSQADIILIVVGTPVKANHEPDLSQVASAGRAVAAGLRRGQLVVLESTVYPGATKDALIPALEASGLKAGKDFGVAHCPERIVPGDHKRAAGLVDRVVGGITPAWTNVAHAFYQSITAAKVHKVRDVETAEAIKCLENTQRDLNIALSNEMALMCERLGLDVWQVIEGASSKWNFMRVLPGTGVGGHCLPVDPWYLYERAKRAGFEGQLIPTARRVNDSMPAHLADLVGQEVTKAGGKAGKGRVVVLGAAYKENLGDIRESPSVELAHELARRGYETVVVDPHVTPAQLGAAGLNAGTTVLAAAAGAHAIVLATAHKAFERQPWSKVRAAVAIPVFVDGRRSLAGQRAEKAGFSVRVLGRGT